MPDVQHVKITVTCACGEVICEATDTIEEKYPFWCGACEEYSSTGKYPWKLTTEIVTT